MTCELNLGGGVESRVNSLSEQALHVFKTGAASSIGFSLTSVGVISKIIKSILLKVSNYLTANVSTMDIENVDVVRDSRIP